MKIFNEIKGKKLNKYGDDLIYIRIPCSKRKGEEPNNKLKDMLLLFNLNTNTSMSDLKIVLFKKLNINLIYSPKSRLSIKEKNINNAADIPILREKEGILIIEKLGLRKFTTKSEIKQKLFDFLEIQ